MYRSCIYLRLSTSICLPACLPVCLSVYLCIYKDIYHFSGASFQNQIILSSYLFLKTVLQNKKHRKAPTKFKKLINLKAKNISL